MIIIIIIIIITIIIIVIIVIDVLNFAGATTNDILIKIDDVLDKKPESIIIHVGTNDLKNDINLLSNV